MDINFFSGYKGSDKEELGQFDLIASWIDPTFVRQKVLHDMVREIGGNAPRTTYARVLVNGAFQGFYGCFEKISSDYIEFQGWDSGTQPTRWGKLGNIMKAVSHDSNWRNLADPLAGYTFSFSFV